MSFQLFATTFGIIFVAELPDKTALAALVLATRHRALPVFLGASLALSLQSVVAVAAGTLLTRLDHRYVQLGSAAMFLVCAALMWLRKPDADEHHGETHEGFLRPLWTTFVVIFIAEWGDLTQIGTAALQARYASWPAILLGSIAALWAVTAVAVTVGNRAAKILDPRVTQRVAAVVFATVAIILVASAL